MKKLLYVVDFWELGKPEKTVPYGYFKSFNKALEAAKRLDSKNYRWSITERQFGKIDVLEDYRIAFSFDHMVGDILVKAGQLFSVHGARVACRDISKMAVKQDFTCQSISGMMVKQDFACQKNRSMAVNRNAVCRNTGNIVKNRGGVARRKRG